MRWMVGAVWFAGCWLVLAAPTTQTAPMTPAGAASIKKYTASPAVRLGMEHIAVLLTRAQAEGLKKEDYIAIADQLDAEILNVARSNKGKEPTKDRVVLAIRDVLADLMRATALLRHDKLDFQRAGVLALTQSLKNYARYFEHPGWKGPQ